MTVSLVLALTLIGAPPSDRLLTTLRPEHPRLIAVSEDLARVKELIATDARAAAVAKKVTAEADSLLKAAPLARVLKQRSSMSMLDTGRKCVERLYTLATVYRLSGDRRYADRAIAELLAVAEFSDCNPSVFLDTAETTHGVAIGYDWLFDVLSESQRRTIRKALVDKGLREGERAYRQKGSWTRARHNWNQVCNGAMVIGALAVAEDEPELAEFILQKARESLPLAMAEYAPDGAWPEGPGYWSYATRYTTYLLASLQSALGTDFGLSNAPGFAKTGEFRMQLTGPTRLAFNFSDGSARGGGLAEMYWLARRFDRPDYAWYVREGGHCDSPLHLWWFDPRGDQPPKLPNDAWFRHVDVAMMRSRWHDPRAVFVAFRGGDNGANHSHLELGNFVLDADGQRWAMALGPDAYSLPGYFGRQRWTYYRTGTAGQNTLRIDGQNQAPKAAAPITAFFSSADRAHAVADLSAGYADQAKRVCRGVALLQRRQVLIQDELESVSGREIVWQVHTGAKIELHGNRAVLSQQGETMQVRILSPSSAKFDSEQVEIPPPQHAAPGVSKLIVKLNASKAPQRLAILFTPGSAAATSKTPSLAPLKSWPGGVRE